MTVDAEKNAEQDVEQDTAPNVLPGNGRFRARPNVSIGGESPRHSSVHATSALPDGKVRQRQPLHVLHLDDYVLRA